MSAPRSDGQRRVDDAPHGGDAFRESQVDVARRNDVEAPRPADLDLLVAGIDVVR